MSESAREFALQCGPVTYYINSSRMSAGKGKGDKKRYVLAMVRKLDDGHAATKVVIGGAVLRRVRELPPEAIKEYLDDTIALVKASNPNRVRIHITGQE